MVEALRAGVPGSALLLVRGLDHDQRVSDALELARAAEIPINEVSRFELDRATSGAVHQGLGLVVPPWPYQETADLLARATAGSVPALLVACDGVEDPRNLGAIVRSAAALGAAGVIVRERRAVGMTAAAWKASAGAAARMPIARATNLTRALHECADAGLVVVGLDAKGELCVDDLEAAIDPLVLVVGSEGRGLSRLVSEACDLHVAIPLTAAVESLNAATALAVALAEVARRRRRTHYPSAASSLPQ